MTRALHLYALVDRRLDEHPPRGAFGEELVQVETSSLVAVAGALDATPAEDVAHALAHAELVEQLARRGVAVLPARFGTRFGGADLLKGAVDAQAARLRSALDAVRGCVEIGLAAVFPREQELLPRTGREYLERRLRAARLVDALVRDVHRPLEALARDARLRQAIAPPRFGASYLVAEADMEEFAAAADEVTAAAGVDVVRGGPWPPYSFADTGADA